MRFLVLGRGDGLVASAELLIRRGHELAGVVTSRPTAEHRVGPVEYRALADAHGAPFIQTQVIAPQVADEIRAMRADVGISMNWVTILRASDLGLMANGALNAHFGDLPRYRGNAAVNWAILAGEPQVSLTVHRMEGDQLDSGQILAQHRINIGPTTTADEVLREGYAALPDLYAIALEGLAPTNDAPPSIQDGFRTYPRLPRDGLIDWTSTAVEIDRLIRATGYPYPGAYTYLRDDQDLLRRLTIWQARVDAESVADRGVPGHVIRNDRSTGESLVLTGQGILALQRVSLDSDPGEFAPGTRWRSIRIRLGMQVEDEIYRLTRLVRAQDDK